MELNKLYNMDCLIGMQEIHSDSVDLIICDPPYGTIKGIGKSTDKFNKDTFVPLKRTRYLPWTTICGTGVGIGSLLILKRKTYRAQLDRLRNEYRIL